MLISEWILGMGLGRSHPMERLRSRSAFGSPGMPLGPELPRGGLDSYKMLCLTGHVSSFSLSHSLSSTSSAVTFILWRLDLLCCLSCSFESHLLPGAYPSFWTKENKIRREVSTAQALLSYPPLWSRQYQYQVYISLHPWALFTIQQQRVRDSLNFPNWIYKP